MRFFLVLASIFILSTFSIGQNKLIPDFNLSGFTVNDSGSSSFGSKNFLFLERESNLKPSLGHRHTSLPIDRSKISSSTLPIAIGVWSFLYLLNPIILFENDKIAMGLTKEVSVGFGYFGEHRASFEYSYIFRSDLNSNIRLGYKYDILLEPGLKPSNVLQGTTVISPGVGYFNNFSRPGYFGETAFGYSIRNDKFLFYPHLKLRFTYVAEGSNIFDFSFGIIIGLANPFIDLKIRRDAD